MTVIPTTIPDVLILEPKVFGDQRGFFFETYNERDFRQATCSDARFVQDNHSGSVRGVLRGLHYQVQHAQGKLVRALSGAIWDVAVDLRRFSPTFGKWAGYLLSQENRRMLWIPPGFAHGFVALADWNEVAYKATDFWAPEHERTVLWNDPALKIEWPLAGIDPVLSNKDREGVLFQNAQLYEAGTLDSKDTSFEVSGVEYR
jgi:dTDP-4-dehydrorhamnose 3,5-epimerase